MPLTDGRGSASMWRSDVSRSRPAGPHERAHIGRSRAGTIDRIRLRTLTAPEWHLRAVSGLWQRNAKSCSKKTDVGAVVVTRFVPLMAQQLVSQGATENACTPDCPVDRRGVVPPSLSNQLNLIPAVVVRDVDWVEIDLSTG